MKNLALLFLFALLSILTQGQDTKLILKKYPKEVQKIIKSETGAFRGNQFGSSKASILAAENLKFTVEADTAMTTTLSLEGDNSADIIYYLDKDGKAKSFAIVFILNDVIEEQNLRIQLMKYFTEKYGKYTVINEEDELWSYQNEYSIEMRDTSDEAGMEIEIVFYKN